MRNRFVTELERAADENPRIQVLVGDIGFGVFESFQRKHPDRFHNMGIAEQNMLSVAAGLSKERFLPVVYTIIPFLTMRAFEQIRVDICMHNRDALLIGVGGGYAYDILGPTHHALEDVSLMKSLPKMSIFSPATPSQITDFAMELFEKSSGPKYLRLGKNGEQEFSIPYEHSQEFGSFMNIRQTKELDLALISHGPISFQVHEALILLSNLGLKIKHYSVYKIEPISEYLLKELSIIDCPILVIEENYLQGSLYADIVVELEKEYHNEKKNVIASIHPRKEFYTRVAARSEILKDSEMDAPSIALRAKKLLD